MKQYLNIIRENYFKAKIVFPAKLTFKWGEGDKIKTFSGTLRIGSLSSTNLLFRELLNDVTQPSLPKRNL